MKKIFQIVILLIPFLFFSQQKKDTFLVGDKAAATPIFIDTNSDDLIVWAANELADNIGEIIGKKPKIIKTNIVQAGKGIYIGLTNDSFFKNNKEPKDSIAGAWEKFSIRNKKDNLFLMGSDIRGTVCGIFEIAERLGISPWKWWADVNNIKKNKLLLEIPSSGIVQSPSVQYRGIFLNDEDWGLQPWAAKTFEPETGDIGPKTYEKIFQLLLRLKANTIWPAMHDCTKAFFSIPGNKEMAQKYHIIIGSSHAEPMLRNNVSEWNKKEFGAFNYFTNSQKVDSYWQNRLDEIQNSNTQTIMTLGMRGVHDSQMEGAKNTDEAKEMVEKILLKQRNMLVSTFKKPIAEIPQVLIP